MYKKTTLDNGLRIVTHDMKERDSVALGIWIGVGGRYEEDKIRGAAHFLEHVVFKGSRKYSCEEIKEKIEGVGGMLNAFTSEEQTCYYAKFPSKHLKRSFDVLGDMVFHPNIAPKDVKKESTVIIEEIKMYRDLPQYYVIELMDELLWPDHPLGKALTGTTETVAGMTSADLKKFHGNYYIPKNIVIAASGQLKHDDIVGLVKDRLSRVHHDNKIDFTRASNVQKSPRVNLFVKQTEQMHLALGMLGYHEEHPDRYALSLLSIILGGNMSSRLFVEVREKRGLAYSIGTSMKSLHDTGMFMVRAGVDNNKIVQTLDIVIKELEKIKRGGVTEGEFKRGKDYLIGQLVLGLEDTMEHMLWLGEGVISRDKLKTIKDVITKFNKVTRAHVKAVAKHILDPKHFNLAIVGNLKDEQQDLLKKRLGL